MTGIYTEKYADAFSTTLTAAITVTTRPVTFTVAANSAQLASGNFRVAIFNLDVGGNPINVERLKVTTVTGLSWTATTEASSAAVTHPSGSTVQAIVTAESLIQDMVDHTTPVTEVDPHTQYLRKATFTTKGDSLVGTGAGTFTREAVGASGTVLTSDPTTPTGRRWQAAVIGVLSRIGDLIEMTVNGAARLPIGAAGQLLTSTLNTSLVSNPSIAPSIANTTGTSTWAASTTYFIGYTWVLGLPGGVTGETAISPLTTYASPATPSVQAVTSPAFPAVPAGTTAAQLNIYVGLGGGAMHLAASLVGPSTSTTNTVNVPGPNVTGATPTTVNSTGGFGAAWADPPVAPVSVVTKTAAYTITSTDNVILADATAGAFTITLPVLAGVATGKHYTIKKIDSSANAVTISRAGTDLIDGATTKSLTTQYATIDVLADPTDGLWQIDPLATPGFTNPMTAVGDLITGGASGAPARLGPPGASGTVLTSTGATTAPSWQAATGGGGSQPSIPSIFQQTRIRGTGNKTTASATFVVLDNTNLPPLSLTVNSGDIIRCTLGCQVASGAGGVGLDFQVVQPTLGTTRLNSTAADGATLSGGGSRTPVTAVATFTAAETGVHTFQPFWLSTSGTSTIYNGTTGADDTEILFIVERVGVTVVPPASQSSLIQEFVVGTAQATISLSNIPQSYRDLRIEFDGRGDAAVTDVVAGIQLNTDTAANYDSYGLAQRNGASANIGGAGLTFAQLLDIPAASAPANVSAGGVIVIPNYTASTFQKQAFCHGGLKNAAATTGLYAVVSSGFWRNSAPVTSITLVLSSGNFVTGTTVRLYGEPATSLPKIGEVVLAASAATVSFSSIPQTYSHLKLVVQARSDAAGTPDNQIQLQFNADTASNYFWQRGHYSTTNIVAADSAGAVAQIEFGWIQGATAPAGVASSIRAEIPNYSRSTFNKSLTAECMDQSATFAAGAARRFSHGGQWNSTAAITSITIKPATGNLIAGSVFTLYGEP